MIQPMATVKRIAVSLPVGLVAWFLLVPFHGIDPIPPQCFALVGYPVPCGDELSIAVGVATAGIVGLALWFRSRRRDRTRPER